MLKTFACSIAASMLISATADAALLGVVLQAAPDISSGGITTNYNAGTQAFTANGTALFLNGNFINAGTFNITASISNAGAVNSGSLTINGSVLSFGSPLITGSLQQIGWSTTSFGLFDFIFSVTGGSMAVNGQFGPIGSQFGVIMSTNGSTFNGSWAQNFTNTASGVSDTAPLVPAPGAAALLLAAFCQGRGRRRQA